MRCQANQQDQGPTSSHRPEPADPGGVRRKRREKSWMYATAERRLPNSMLWPAAFAMLPRLETRFGGALKDAESLYIDCRFLLVRSHRTSPFFGCLSRADRVRSTAPPSFLPQSLRIAHGQTSFQHECLSPRNHDVALIELGEGARQRKPLSRAAVAAIAERARVRVGFESAAAGAKVARSHQRGFGQL